MSKQLNIVITGEAGFIGKNLISEARNRGHNVIELLKVPHGLAARRKTTKEPCVFSNLESTWIKTFQKYKVDLVIHNAAVVGTDVVSLDPADATLSNVTGTHIISRAAEKCKIPVCFLGTSVIYNTPLYQNNWITEESEIHPLTFYGQLKYTGELTVRAECSRWLIMRPLFAYGGIGDMNSLIAKTIYSSVNSHKKLDMFLDPEKVKDYMHVSDFSSAVLIACEKSFETGRWNNDFNVSSHNSLKTSEIVKLVGESLKTYGYELPEIVWYPKTDYLGNHILYSEKFREYSLWKPRVTLAEGIERSVNDIIKGKGQYNPLKYLEQAQKSNVNIIDYFPKSAK